MSCITPIAIKVKDLYGQEKKTNVPCGYCYKCRKKYRRDWSFRLQQEAKDHIFKFMITLTYDDENLVFKPCKVANKETGEIGLYMNASLHKEDLTKFIKRMRINQERHIKKHFPHEDTKNYKIRYYAVGEYGSICGRPHYHIITFGLLPYIRDRLQKIWDKGFVHKGDIFSDKCISYTTKYLLKSKKEKDSLLTGHPEPEFSVMSNGIGKRFITKGSQYNITKGKHEYSSLLVRNNEGHLQLMPRYLRNLIMSQGSYLDKAIETLAEDSKLKFWKNYHKVSKREDFAKWEKEQIQNEIRRTNQQYNNNSIF